MAAGLEEAQHRLRRARLLANASACVDGGAAEEVLAVPARGQHRGLGQIRREDPGLHPLERMAGFVAAFAPGCGESLCAEVGVAVAARERERAAVQALRGGNAVKRARLESQRTARLRRVVSLAARALSHAHDVARKPAVLDDDAGFLGLWLACLCRKLEAVRAQFEEETFGKLHVQALHRIKEGLQARSALAVAKLEELRSERSRFQQLDRRRALQLADEHAKIAGRIAQLEQYIRDT